MNNFYVYLPSNNNFLESNRSYKYVTKLAKDVSLNGRWEVALKEIHYPHSWATLTPHECSFVLARGEEGDNWREVTIDSGYYSTGEALVEAIDRAIDDRDIVITYSPSSRRIEMTLPEQTTLHFAEPLSSMLGLGYGNVVCNSAMRRGMFPIDCSRGIDALYVYSDIVQTKLVGDTSVPILAVVPVTGEHGAMAFKEYSTPVYTDLSKDVFSTIEIYLMDSAGRSIPFEFGKLTVLLHFRKRQ